MGERYLELVLRVGKVLEPRADADEADPIRRRWLAAQLAGIEAACRRLAGERISNELGERLCRRWVAGDPAKRKRLPAEQLTTEDLL